MIYIRLFFIATTTLVVAILISGLTACAGPKQVGPKPISNHWAYAPDTLKIHPLSRFNHDGELVVHASLLDGDGFACRGVGTLIVAVATPSNTNPVTITIQLEDPEVNRNYFDDVTRTYRIPVADVAEDIDRVVVRTTFTGLQEEPIKSDTYTVTRKKSQ